MNNQNISSEDLGFDILTVIADENNIFEKDFKDFNNRKKVISTIYSIINSPKLKEDKPKQSNLNFKESNKILSIYHLPPLNEKYKDELNKLVTFRNFIAHGDNISTNFDMELIRDFVFLVENLMDDFIFNIL